MYVRVCASGDVQRTGRTIVIDPPGAKRVLHNSNKDRIKPDTDKGPNARTNGRSRLGKEDGRTTLNGMATIRGKMFGA